ncbi:MAG: peptidoglycan bridge formation glycyltransferase FemA/FemB family protein, partial [Candidatus Saccharibacteria bacterium]
QALARFPWLDAGPGVASLSELKNLIPALHAFAKKQGVFTIKIESELPADTSTDAAIVALGVIKTRPIQPNYSTVLIDVRPSLDDIIKALPQKGRHAIRRAERDGVTVKKVPASKQNCEVMFKLLSDTAKGAGFGIRSYDYYEKFWQRYEKAGLGQLFFAYFEGKIVAGAFAIVFGDKGTYKDGASIRERTAYGASHLLQWHIIEWVKQQGAAVHDLCGAPPASEIKNPAHSYYGIGLFKTSFNKTVTEYVGAYQIPVRPLRSKLWTRFLEKLIRKIYYKIHHESYY